MFLTLYIKLIIAVLSDKKSAMLPSPRPPGIADTAVIQNYFIQPSFKLIEGFFVGLFSLNKKLSYGNVQLPTGYRKLPTGNYTLPNGYKQLPDSYNSLPDGYVYLPSGYRILPSGYVTKSNGNVLQPYGRYLKLKEKSSKINK